MSTLPPPLPAPPPPTEPLPLVPVRLPAFSFGASFSVGWEVFSRNWGALTLAGLVSGLIALVAMFLPYIGWAASLLVAPIASSLTYIAVRAARGETAQFEWLFSQLRPYGTLLVINLVSSCLVVALIIAILAAAGVAGLSGAIAQSGWAVLLAACFLMPLLAVALLLVIYIRIRWSLATTIALDDAAGAVGVTAALRRSWELTRGRVLPLLAISIVLWLLHIAGFMLLIIGSVLFTTPLAVAVTGAACALILAEAHAASPRPPASSSPTPPAPAQPEGGGPGLYGEGLSPSLS